jgi:hypothetical protein
MQSRVSRGDLWMDGIFGSLLKIKLLYIPEISRQ